MRSIGRSVRGTSLAVAGIVFGDGGREPDVMTTPVLCAVRALPALDDLQGLPTDEARRMRRDRVRQRHEVGRALLSELLQSATGRADWVVVVDSRGKPALERTNCVDAPAISISHSAGLVAATVCRLGPVGIDVERHDPRRDVAALARYAFGPVEQAAVAQGGIEAFFRIWTLREAMSKATGEGIAMAADGIDRIGQDPPCGAWRTLDRRWLLAHVRYRDYSLALAIRANDPGLPWSEKSIEWLE